MPETGRGSLPFALLRGESLVAIAAFALEAAGIELIDPRADLDVVRGSGWALVLHDPLCPLTPVDFIAEITELAVESDAVVAAYRPVTDTVKRLVHGVDGDLVAGTHDREELVELTSPVVFPPSVVDLLDALPSGDVADIVDEVRRRWPLRFVEAPVEGRRVRRAEDLALLEAVSAP